MSRVSVPGVRPDHWKLTLHVPSGSQLVSPLTLPDPEAPPPPLPLCPEGHVPQEPPHPSLPQVRPEQFGVQPPELLEFTPPPPGQGGKQ
jgi:hypothetical protein